QLALARALEREGQRAVADRAAVEVLGERADEMPGGAVLLLHLQCMHGQAVARGGSAHEALVEGNVGAQAGDLLVAVRDRALQVAVGIATDLVGAAERGDALAQLLGVVAQPRLLTLEAADLRARIARDRCEQAPRTPTAEADRHEENDCAEQDGPVFAEPGSLLTLVHAARVTALTAGSMCRRLRQRHARSGD